MEPRVIMDPRVTLDRHGLGEGQAVAHTGDDLGGVRWRTSDKAALAAKLAQIH